MRRLFVGMLLCLGVLVTRVRADDRIDLRVLYCGDPGSAREADFQSFLKQHFTSAALADGTAFKEEQAKDADVVIFDWTSIYKGDSPDTDKLARMRKTTPELSEKYARPSILIGARGGTIGEKLKLKINWLCLCLDGPAYHLAVNHPLFHTPLAVNPELEETPTPEDYQEMALDKSLGPTMKAWRVQTKDCPEIDPGMVSDVYGFADSPDAEVIAQGPSQNTLALGRQANFFLWGFSAGPADMTPSGQRLLVNVIAYMRQFDGQKPLVHKASQRVRSREWALRFALLPSSLTEEGQAKRERELRESLEKTLKDNPDLLPKEALSDLQSYIKQRIKEDRENLRSSVEGILPESLRKQFGMAADKYSAYYLENREYLRPEEGDGLHTTGFLVDEDAKSLGTSNRRVESLEKWISMLERAEQSELALRLLKRYTQEDFDTGGKWRAWLNKNRDHLFFSDIGGFKFFVAPAG